MSAKQVNVATTIISVICDAVKLVAIAVTLILMCTKK